jgi:hypothetical protein
MKKLYFGHPVNTYGTELESRLLNVIKDTFCDWAVENPNQQKHREGYAKRKAATGNGMGYFTEQVLPSCGGGIFLPFSDGRWGAGVYGEAETLRDAGKPIWAIDSRGHIAQLMTLTNPLSVAETRQRVYDPTGALKPYPTRPRVALDVDGTLADIHATVLPKWSKITGKIITKEMCIGWNGLNKVTGNPEAYKDYITFWLDYPAQQVKPIEPNVNELTHAIGTVADVDIVTSHSEPSRKNLAEWLSQNAIAYNKLLLVGASADAVKGETMRQQGADKTSLPYDVFIDDNEEIAKKLLPTQVLFLFTRPWNIHAQEQPGRLVRITSLAQVPSLLLNLP